MTPKQGTGFVPVAGFNYNAEAMGFIDARAAAKRSESLCIL
jgi:hypothetical protein